MPAIPMTAEPVSSHDTVRAGLAILELGAGQRPTAGCTAYHDRTKHSPHITVAHDLDIVPWPWEAESFDRIVALSVMAHLRLDVFVWLSECHRILKPGGSLLLRLPACDNVDSFRDPTSQRAFHPQSFHFFDPGTDLWREYGWYYPGSESERWWRVVSVERTNPGPEGVGDLGFLLEKR